MTNFVNHRGHIINHMFDDDFWAGIKSWEVETFEALDNYLGKGKTFLDIGAWNGVFSLYAASLGATVYAVEPDPVAYDKLVKNISLNSSNIIAINEAVSDKTGAAYLWNEDGNMGNSMSSLIENRYDAEVPWQVKTTTITDLISKYEIKPDLIKMDIEGGEGIVIPYSFGALKKLSCPLHLSIHPVWIMGGDFKNLILSIRSLYGVDIGHTINTSNTSEWLLKPKQQ